MAKLKLDFKLHVVAVAVIMLWAYFGAMFIPTIYFSAIAAVLAMAGKGLFDVYCAKSKLDTVDYAVNVFGFILGLTLIVGSILILKQFGIDLD